VLRKPYKVGGKSSTGHTIAEILGQGPRAFVFTTTNNELRWAYYYNDGNLSEQLEAIVTRFDTLMTEIKALQISTGDKHDIYVLLGKSLFGALSSSKPGNPTGVFAEVKKRIDSHSGEAVPPNPDSGARADGKSDADIANPNQQKEGSSWFAAIIDFFAEANKFLVALTGVILAIGGLYVASVTVFKPTSGGGGQTPSPVQSPSPTPSAHTSDCFKQYFADLPEDPVAPRMKRIKSGPGMAQIIQPRQTKDGLMGIEFIDDSGQPIGGTKFKVDSTSGAFTVQSVANSNCQEIRDYRNDTGGGNMNELLNWGYLYFSIDRHDYKIRLGYDGGAVTALFQKTS
jgi:hypothetical protein